MVTTYTFTFGSAATPLDAGTAQSPSSDFNNGAGLTFSLPLFDSNSAQTLESVTATLSATVDGTVLAYNFTVSPETSIAFQNAYTQVALALEVPGNSTLNFVPEATVSGTALPFLPPSGTYTATAFAATSSSTSNAVVFTNPSAFEAPGGGTLTLTLVSNGGSVGGPTLTNLAFGTNSDITVYGSANVSYTSLLTSIPEPQAWAAIVGGAALAAALLGRARRRSPAA